MCQQSPASNGVRNYVLNNYQAVKQNNPEFPFIVREAVGAEPCVMARYEYGVERRVYLNNASEAEVKQSVDELVQQAKAINSAVGGGKF